MEDIERLRDKLKEFVEYDKGYAIREFIHELALEHYEKKHSETKHLEFLERHEVKIERNHSQSVNHPYYFTMFSIITQHIMGDTVAELLDKAIDIEEKASLK